MAVADRSIEEVRRIVMRELSGLPVDVYLFGSSATDTRRRASDVDVAVLPRRPIPAGTIAHLRETLEESSVPYAVDVVDLREADPRLRARVLREGIKWSV